jgi:hypothetical protein
MTINIVMMLMINFSVNSLVIRGGGGGGVEGKGGGRVSAVTL